MTAGGEARGGRGLGQGEVAMTDNNTAAETISNDKYYDDHAALLGHVTLAWNDCHYMVLSIFHTLSGLSWEQACKTFFFEQKYDHNRLRAEVRP
jgi:hypothetical protein